MADCARFSVSRDERSAGRLGIAKQQDLVEALNAQGVAIVEDLLDPAALGAIAAKLTHDLEAFQARPRAWTGGGRIIGHLNAVPPTAPDYLSDELLFNPILFGVSEALFGEPTANVKFTCNCNLPGSVRQSFHPDFRRLECIDQLNVSIALCDVDERNGSTEVIPGTHRTKFSFRRLDAVLAETAPVRANARLGSAMLWYPSLWHRGTANASPAVRHMLTLTHAPLASASYREASPTVLPETARAFVGNRMQRIKTTFAPLDGNSIFSANYFKPTWTGVLRETLHAASPRTSEFLMKQLGR